MLLPAMWPAGGVNANPSLEKVNNTAAGVTFNLPN